MKKQEQDRLIYRIADALGVLVPLDLDGSSSLKSKILVLLAEYDEMNDPKNDWMDTFDEDDELDKYLTTDWNRYVSDKDITIKLVN